MAKPLTPEQETELRAIYRDDPMGVAPVLVGALLATLDATRTQLAEAQGIKATLRANAHKFVEECAPLLMPTLVAERNEARRQLNESTVLWQQAVTARDTLTQQLAARTGEVAALRSALRRFGHHSAGCATHTAGTWMHVDAAECGCGLEAATREDAETREDEGRPDAPAHDGRVDSVSRGRTGGRDRVRATQGAAGVGGHPARRDEGPDGATEETQSALTPPPAVAEAVRELVTALSRLLDAAGGLGDVSVADVRWDRVRHALLHLRTTCPALVAPAGRGE